jgi:hypothetical protein
LQKERKIAAAAADVVELVVDGCFPSDEKCNAVVLAAVESIAAGDSGGDAHTNPCAPVNPCQNGGACVDTTPVPAHTPVSFSCACTRFFTGRVCTVPEVFVTSSSPPTVSLRESIATIYGHGYTPSLRIVDIAVDRSTVAFNFSKFSNETTNAGEGRRLLLNNASPQADMGGDSMAVISEPRGGGGRHLLSSEPLFYWTATFVIPSTTIEGYRPINVSFANSFGASSWSSSALVYAANSTCKFLFSCFCLFFCAITLARLCQQSYLAFS